MRASPGRPGNQTAATRCGSAVIVALMMSSAGWYGWYEYLRTTGPQTLDEVVARAEQLGLYYRSDRADGQILSRLIVSDQPIDVERANDVRLNTPTHPCWVGTLAVCTKGRDMLINFSPGRSVLWGDLFIIGDPELIRRLTGLDPGQPCRHAPWHLHAGPLNPTTDLPPPGVVEPA